LGGLSLLLLFGSATFLTPCAVEAGGGLPAGIVGADSRAVVRVASYDWRGVFLREGYGVIATPRGELVTAISLFDGAYFSEVIFPDGEIHVVEYIQKVNEASGLLVASLEDPAETLPSLNDKTSFPESGSSVWVFSDTGSRELKIVETKMEEVREIGGLGAFRYARTSVAVGGPGTPILNRSGEVAGIVVLSLPDPYGGLIIASSAIMPAEAARNSGGNKDPGMLQESWAEGRDVNWYETQRGSYLKGVAKLWSGDHGAARLLLAEALWGKGRRSGYANLALGNSCLAGGDLDRAVEAFMRAVEKLRNSMDAMVGLARAYLAQGKINEARSISEQAAIDCPEDARTLAIMALVMSATNHTKEAVALARSAVELDPACAEAAITLGELLVTQGRFKEAAAMLESVPASFRMEKGFSGDLCYVSLRSGKLARAVETCSWAVARGEDEALLYLGEAYSRMGSNEKAQDCFSRSLENNPDSLSANCRLGDLLLSMGKVTESVKLYERAVTRRPRSAWLRFKLGKALCLLGDREAATQQLAALKELNPMLAQQLALRLPAP
jgi:tetratricopeptide (TPR) repeat protein